MRSSSLVLFAASAAAQTTYGNNHVSVNFDSQIVERNAFPEPDVALYSPAFMPNASFPAGWTEGTQGATSQDELGKKYGNWKIQREYWN
jgi:hypothetical protein